MFVWPSPWTTSLTQRLQLWSEQPPGHHSMGSAGLQLTGSAGEAQNQNSTSVGKAIELQE